jgi:hypothetical protein
LLAATLYQGNPDRNHMLWDIGPTERYMQTPGLLKKNENKPARSFNFIFRYIDDVLSLNNGRFGDFVDRIYALIYSSKLTVNGYE